MRFAPSGAIAVKQELRAGAARGDLLEEFEALGRKLDMADLAGL